MAPISPVFPLCSGKLWGRKSPGELTLKYNLRHDLPWRKTVLNSQEWTTNGEMSGIWKRGEAVWDRLSFPKILSNTLPIQDLLCPYSKITSYVQTHKTISPIPKSFLKAFSSHSPLSPNPHHQPLLNFIFSHCSDNHCDKSYVSNYNNRLSQCWSSAFLGDRNRICLPGNNQGGEQTQASWRSTGPAG